jgi:hypothetical protein
MPLFYISTPDRYVEIGGSKLNEVSYQLARAYCVPCKGVYVAEASGSKYLNMKTSLFPKHIL